MKKYLYLILAVALCISSTNILAQSLNAKLSTATSGKDTDIQKMLQYYDKKLYFTENKGQWPEHVLYRTDFPLGQALVTKQGMIVGTFDAADIAARNEEINAEERGFKEGHAHKSHEGIIKGHGWMMNFINSSPSMSIESKSRHREVFNYIHGDATGSKMGANNFQEIWYNNVYDNVDVRYYPSEQGTLEYDIIAKPGFDKNNIALRLDGIEQIYLKKNGHLVLKTSVGDMDLPAPVAYQRIDGKQIKVKSSYELTAKNELKFKLGKYDESQILVIDPIALRWATWITNNSQGANHGHCIWVDQSDGAIYVAGRIMGTGLITVGAIQPNYAGPADGSSDDLYIGKYVQPGTIGGAGVRVWQTYLGGAKEDNPLAMEQGPDGFLYIVGYTSSSDFPLSGGDLGGASIDNRLQKTDNGFVVKMSTDGQSYKAAVIGGDKNDWLYDLRITPAGDILTCGYSASGNLNDLFPGKGAVNVPANTKGREVFVFKINSDLSAISWMKNYGGAGDDYGQIMLNDPATGNIYIGGQTWSGDFPTMNARQGTFTGKVDGILQKLDASGNFIWSSYFNSAALDSTAILCMDFNEAKNRIYFGGVSTGLAASNVSASGVLQSAYGGGANDFFVTLMDTNQTLVKSTYLGGRRNEVNMMGLNADQNNDVYVFGYTNSRNFPVTSDALQPLLNITGTDSLNSDKTFTKLNSGLDAVLFSTYYGGSGDDYDPAGERGIKFLGCRIYTIVTSASNNLPLTEGAITTSKVSSTSIYEPGLVVWANPPDLVGNAISGNQSVCNGSIPATDLTGPVSSYTLPNISRNNVISAYPVDYNSAISYQWQSSPNNSTWTNVPGGNTQNLAGSVIGPITQKTYFRRILGGDACQRDDGTTVIIDVITPEGGDTTAVACDSFTWYGTTYTTGGDKTHLFAGGSKAGCDSTVTLHLTINHSTSGSESQTACNSYVWNETTYTSGGDKTHLFPGGNAKGCDSTATLHLTINPSTSGSESQTACNSYVWNGTTYTTGGDKTHLFTGGNAKGCDSTATLHLTINLSSSGSESQTACNNYVWNGTTYTTGGDKTHLFTGGNAKGCDSTATLHLTINLSSSGSESQTACNSYVWNGATYTTGGDKTHLFTGGNAKGCDSTATLHLTINLSSSGSESQTACNSYVWNGTTYTTGGDKTHLFTGGNAKGCDSTATLHLTINLSSSGSESQTACNSYVWNGTTYTTGGDKTHLFTGGNAKGCDSTATLHLTIYQSSSSSFSATGCDSYKLSWDGTVTVSDDYVHTFFTVNECDSVVTLHLTINHSSSGSESQTACNSYVWNGTTYTTGGDKTHLFEGGNAKGCDSTATLHLTINPSTSGSESKTSCNSYVWNGTTYTTGGDKTHLFVGGNAKGCDSTATLHLTIGLSTSGSESRTACNSYIWNETTYTTSGDKTYLFPGNVEGCDSIATLHLTINTSTSGSESQTACNNYVWIQTTYTTGGDKTHLFPGGNAKGCDSTATLHLTINPSTSGSESRTACNSYVWNGATYTTSGDKTHLFVGGNAKGCDSTATLHLTINLSSSGSESRTACNSYVWNGVTYTTSGDKTHLFSGGNAKGCDSTATLHLTINLSSSGSESKTACNSYVWNGTTYTTSGDKTHLFVGGNAKGCDSTATLHLTIGLSTSGSESRTACNSYVWNETTYTTSGDKTFLFPGDVEGCDSIATLHLTINTSTFGSESRTACNSYVWNGTTYTTSGDKTHLFSGGNAKGCDSMATLHLTINLSSSGSESKTACNSYVWNGATYTTSGDKTHLFAGGNAKGCDSTATLHLTINLSSSGSESRTACNSYVWNGVTYTTSGDKTHLFAGGNAKGCDSTATLHLTINHSSSSSFSVTACDSYDLPWDGAVTESNSYVHTYKTINDCDSIVTAHVTITSSPAINIITQGGTDLCQGSSKQLCASGATSYVWSTGETTTCIIVSSGGTYSVTGSSPGNCTGTASTRIIGHQPPNIVINLQGNPTICQGGSTQLCASGADSSYLWSNGATTACITVSPQSTKTYSVVGTDKSGCTGTGSQEVTVYEKPNCTITGDNMTCSGGSTQLCAPAGMAVYAWSTGASTQCISVSSTGSYSVTVTSEHECVNSCDKYVSVGNGPDCTISGDTSICAPGCAGKNGAGGSTQLCAPYGAGLKYSWSPGGATTRCITVSKAGTYYVTVTNSSGCSSTCYRKVTASQPPVCEIEGKTGICDGGSTQLCAPSGYASYSWSNGATTKCITVHKAGTYYVTVTNSGGCVSTCSVCVTVSSPPSCSITVKTCTSNHSHCQCSLNHSHCSSDNCRQNHTHCQCSQNHGHCYSSNNWSCGSGHSHCKCSSNHTHCTANNCTKNHTHCRCNQNHEHCYTACDNNNFCDGGAVTLVASGGSSYLWSTGATTASIKVTTTGNYTVTVTNSSGCSSTCSKYITIGTPPSCTITGNGSICDGGSTQLCAPAGQGYKYVWSNGKTTQCITVYSAGAYSVTVTNSGGCSSTCSKSVTVNSAPVCSITVKTCTSNHAHCQCSLNHSHCSSDNCKQNHTHCQCSQNHGHCYSSNNWSCGSGHSHCKCSSNHTHCSANNCTKNHTHCQCNQNHEHCYTACDNNNFCNGSPVTLVASGGSSYLWSTGATTASITVSTGGNYTVTVTNSSGCSSTCSKYIAIGTPPSCNITGNGSICDGESTTLSAQAGQGYSYSWSTGATSQSIVVKKAGNYSVTVTNGSGCSSTCSKSVTVSTVPSCLISTGCGSNSICDGQGTSLCGPANCPSDVKFLWSTGEKTRCININKSGTYTLTLTNGNGCSSTCSVYISINTPPSCTISGNTRICKGDYTTLTGPSGSGYSYSWSTGEHTKSIKVNCAGTFYLTVTNNSGCSSTCSVYVSLYSAPVCRISGDLTIGKGQCTTLCAPAGCVSYKWSNGSNNRCITVNSPGTYCVTITNENGCTSTCSVYVSQNGCGWRTTDGSVEPVSSNGTIDASAYPNPFNDVATIEFKMSDATPNVCVEVYTATGALVSKLFNSDAEAGVTYKVQLDAANLVDGMYMYKIISDNNVVNGRLMLVKQ